ncbi:hypothetical protein OG496_30030 [Streptomyces sp. NBC_00988]|nr:hypothetical protein OG496_30030 [Streptomyces sp. NBC_00988]
MTTVDPRRLTGSPAPHARRDRTTTTDPYRHTSPNSAHTLSDRLGVTA